MVVVIPVQSNAITQQVEPHHQLSQISKSGKSQILKNRKGKCGGS